MLEQEEPFMSFSTDRDLLVLEPNVFHEVPLVAQQRLRVTDAVVTGTTVSSAAGDFASAQVGGGSVVLINQVAYEVISRVDDHTLGISLPRSTQADSAIPGGDGSALELIARTFAPQAELVHDGLLYLLGIDAEDPDAVVTEQAIVSLAVMKNLEVLGTLERVYRGAAMLVGENEMLLVKAEEYRRRFREACAASTVLIDADGDGHVEERRYMGVRALARV
jgi:hypothetical protein